MRQLSRLAMASRLLAACLLTPIVAIAYTAIGADGQLFAHLFATVLPTYIINTFIVVAGTMLLAAVFAVPSAWLMARCRLPGEGFLQWALVLPLAAPGYMVAYVYTAWFDYAGPVQMALRDLFNWTRPADYWFPAIRSIGGTCLVLALVFYPYIYLFLRAAFLEQPKRLVDSARLLGDTPLKAARHVSLPLARPALAVGLALVGMEAIGDYGTVSYFAVSTLTTAVYDTWLGYANIHAAAKIAAVMLACIVFLVAAERYSRRRLSLYSVHGQSGAVKKLPLKGWRLWAALLWCWGLLSVAFIAPMIQLVYWAVMDGKESFTEAFATYSLNSLTLSTVSALLTLVVALIMNFAVRITPAKDARVCRRLAAMGYAVPGTVLAIGVMIALSGVDHAVNGVCNALGLAEPGLIFSGTVAAIIVAYVVRFAFVGIGAVESGFEQIAPNMDRAAQTLGADKAALIRQIHLPLLKRSMLVAGILVFIESMKELNAALLLRPFNYETLATCVFNYASDEMLEAAALPAVLLVALGLVPLIVANQALENPQ